MTKKEFAAALDSALKAVRKEYGFTQEKMAVVLGISKKTLVEIEKGRSSLGWTGAAAFAAIFHESGILQAQFGGDLDDWERGVLKNEDGIVTALISKHEAQACEIDELVEKKFEGSLPAFIAAFTKRQDLSNDELDEVQQMIDRIRKGEVT